MNQGNKSANSEQAARIRFLCRIAGKEVELLRMTAGHLFPGDAPVTVKEVEGWIANPVMSERLDAFVARFGRLQDTLGDKLIPALLELLGEARGPAADNLDKAEKFGWIDSAEDWILYRKLRNQMIHDYIEDTRILTDALQAGQAYVPVLIRISEALTREAERRLA